VDKHSTDGTLKILDEFQEKHANVQVVQDGGTRATARSEGIRRVNTDWFLFVDSDVILCKNWFQKASIYLNKDVGAIWGIEVWSTIRDVRMLKFFLWITRKIFDIRGGTHDTLIRREAVKDLHIPSDLHVLEDEYIKTHIANKGFRVVACYDPYCIHFRPESVWTLKGSLDLITESLRIGRIRLVSKLILPYGFYTAYSLFQMVQRKNNR